MNKKRKVQRRVETGQAEADDTDHEFDLVSPQEPTQPCRGPERPETVDTHRVDLSEVGRFRHTPLEDLVDLSDAVPASEEEGFGLAVVNPRVGGEPSDRRESASTEEEARTSIAVQHSFSQSPCRNEMGREKKK